MSGVYDMRRFMDGFYDENFYYNNPIDYVGGMTDPGLSKASAAANLHIATGTGPWEHPADSYDSRRCRQAAGFALPRRLGRARRARLAVLATHDAGVSERLTRLRASTSDFGLQTSDFRLRTSDFASDYGLRGDCGLSTAVGVVRSL